MDRESVLYRWNTKQYRLNAIVEFMKVSPKGIVSQEELDMLLHDFDYHTGCFQAEMDQLIADTRTIIQSWGQPPEQNDNSLF